MKINRLTERLGLLNSVVRPKDDHQTGQERRQQQQQNQGKKDQDFDDILEVTEEKVDAAIAQMNKEAVTQARGLSANVEGSGPGMRIVLKDGTGATIRQFTGEEFLKMRQAVGGDARGKLLDRKL